MPFWWAASRASQNLRRVFDGFFDRQRAFERCTFDELHHQVVRSDIVELADVGVVEGGNGSGFVFESFVNWAWETLIATIAIEAGIAGFVDFAHAARADGRENRVGAEFVAGREERHVKGSAQFTRSRSQ